MNNLTRFLIGFSLFAAFCALVFYVAGFNFDKRTPDVAFGFAMSTTASFVAGMIFATKPSFD